MDVSPVLSPCEGESNYFQLARGCRSRIIAKVRVPGMQNVGVGVKLSDFILKCFAVIQLADFADRTADGGGIADALGVAQGV